jgi:hypothetical protein
MKKVILGALLCGALFACKKTPTEPPVTPPETVEKVNQALFMDYTATWCGPCGQWGTPYFTQVFEDRKTKCIAMAVHSSDAGAGTPNHDDFYNTTTANMTNKVMAKNAFTPRWYPDWYVNNDYAQKTVQGSSSIDLTGSVALAKELIDNFYSSPVVANVKITTTMSGSVLNVRTLTQFFQDGSGDYTLSIYLVEDGIVHKQNVNPNGYQNNYIHDHLLRTAITPVWGDALISNPPKDRQTEKKYTANLESSWNANNVHVVAVVWKKNTDGTYTFVNSSMK